MHDFFRTFLIHALVLRNSNHENLHFLRLVQYSAKDQLDTERDEIELDDGQKEKTPEPLDLNELEAEGESTYFPVKIESEKAENFHENKDTTGTPPPPLENEDSEGEQAIEKVEDTVKSEQVSAEEVIGSGETEGEAQVETTEEKQESPVMAQVAESVIDGEPQWKEDEIGDEKEVTLEVTQQQEPVADVDAAGSQQVEAPVEVSLDTQRDSQAPTAEEASEVAEVPPQDDQVDVPKGQESAAEVVTSDNQQVEAPVADIDTENSTEMAPVETKSETTEVSAEKPTEESVKSVDVLSDEDSAVILEVPATSVQREDVSDDTVAKSSEDIDYSQFDNFECVTSSQENDRSADFESNMACASFTNTSLDLSTLDDQVLATRPPQVPFSENSSTTTDTSSVSDIPSAEDFAEGDRELSDSRENIDDVLAHLQEQHVGFETIVEESNEDLSQSVADASEEIKETIPEEFPEEDKPEVAKETPNRGDFNIPSGFKEIAFKPLQSKDVVVKADDLVEETEKKIKLDPKNVSIFEANKPTPIAKSDPRERVPSSSPESNAEAEAECQPVPETDSSAEVKLDVVIDPSSSAELEDSQPEADKLSPFNIAKSPSMATLESVDVTSSGEMDTSTSCSHELLSETELKRLSCDVDEMSPERTVETINTSKTIEVIQETIVTEIKLTGTVILLPVLLFSGTDLHLFDSQLKYPATFVNLALTREYEKRLCYYA